jgi:hypothetical protein
MTDPVCHIPPVTTINQPGPTALPTVPVAQPNIASLTTTVNTLRQLVIILAGQQGPAGAQGNAGRAGDTAGSWTQTSIVKGTVRIWQNNDPSTGNYVDVEQVNKLVMGNKSTKATWTYNREGS